MSSRTRRLPVCALSSGCYLPVGCEVIGICAHHQGAVPYDPTLDLNRDLRCDCVHPESKHDPTTGACLVVNPTFGPCPCAASDSAGPAGKVP